MLNRLIKRAPTTFGVILVHMQRVIVSDLTLNKLLKDEAPALFLFLFTNIFCFSHGSVKQSKDLYSIRIAG